MASPNQRTGKVYIRIGGTLYESMKGSTLTDPMGVERPAVVGTDVFGFTEQAVVPTVETTFAHGSGVSLQTLAGLVDTTLTFECDSGPVFILSNAWYSKGMKLTGGDGTLAVTFLAKSCREQLS